MTLALRYVTIKPWKGGKDMEDAVEIIKDLLEILVLSLTAHQLVKQTRKRNKSKRRR